MGGISTSQGAVLADKRTNGSSAFDLHSWQGLTQVLKTGKESLKDASVYAEFRNLVLEYAQQGGDPELRKEIDSIIAKFSQSGNTTPTTPVVQTQQTSLPSDTQGSDPYQRGELQKKKRKRNRGGGNNKALPMQDVVQTTPAQAGERTQFPAHQRRIPPAFKASQTPQPTAPRAHVEPPHTLPVESFDPTDTPQQQNVAPVTDTNISQEVPMAVPVTPQSVPIIVTPTEHIQEPVETLKSIDEHKKRIAEIKRTVHEQLGNPATLVGEYNTLGKEYMMALLTALKSTGPGSKESPDVAMRKLEEAFRALQEAPLHQEIKEPQASEKKEEIKKPEPLVSAPEPLSKNFSRNIPTRDLSGEENITRQPSEPTDTYICLGPKVTEVQSNRSHSQRDFSSNNDTAKALNEETIIKEKLKSEPEPVVATMTASLPQTQTPPLPQIKRPNRDVAVAESGVYETKPPHKLSPASTLASLLVRKEPAPENQNVPDRALHELPPEKLATLDIQRLQERPVKIPPPPSQTGYMPVDAVNTSKMIVKQSELVTPEVNRALHQLLEEWQLFKSKGILGFGIGPSGFEHPLYEKLSSLSMGEVISGRWEGSDREVTKIIKEYVDAWRHEQGLAYNAQETFEHYLRRVVLRIQKRGAGEK